MTTLRIAFKAKVFETLFLCLSDLISVCLFGLSTIWRHASQMLGFSSAIPLSETVEEPNYRKKPTYMFTLVSLVSNSSSVEHAFPA